MILYGVRCPLTLRHTYDPVPSLLLCKYHTTRTTTTAIIDECNSAHADHHRPPPKNVPTPASAAAAARLCTPHPLHLAGKQCRRRRRLPEGRRRAAHRMIWRQPLVCQLPIGRRAGGVPLREPLLYGHALVCVTVRADDRIREQRLRRQPPSAVSHQRPVASRPPDKGKDKGQGKKEKG